MQIIPVIDIMNGVAVHAVAGHRQFYQPVQSVITDSTEPVRFLAALKRRLRAETCYVADIDAIQGRDLNYETLAAMTQSGVSLMVDAGIRSDANASDLLKLQIERIVVGAETLESAATLKILAEQFGAERLVFSVDMRNGVLLTANPEWRTAKPLEVAMEAAGFGVSQFILLDLAAIGTGRGVPTLGVCRQLRSLLPTASIVAGGGVRTVADLQLLEQAGADGALVATAVHNGLLKADDIRRFARRAVA